MNPIRSIPLRPNQISIWAHGNEQEAVHLVYDVLNYLEQWPDAIPAVAYQRADGEKYAHNWILDGTIQHIPLSYADTAVAGYNKVMISMMVDGGQANTIVFTGEVLEGIDTQGEEPTEEQQGIIEQVNSAAVRAETAADRAEGAGGDSSMFVIRVDGKTLTADKTVAEINEAVAAGRIPIVLEMVSHAVYTMSENFFGRYYEFERMFVTSAKNGATSWIAYYIYKINSDNTVESYARVPVCTPNNFSLKLTGAVSAEYDGSEAVTVNIPAGGSGGLVDQVQADWNENDPTSKAYVKNRTHWVDASVVDVMPETTFTADALTENGWHVTQPLDGLPATGEMCTVVWNGTEYECPVQSFDMEGVPMSFIGDGIALGEADIGLTGNGEPFAILILSAEVGAEDGVYAAIMPIDGSTTATVAIKVNGEVVHPLDPKYLGAVRGQKKITITIKEDGSITADTPFSEAWAMDEGALQAALCVIVEGSMTSTQSAFGVSKRDVGAVHKTIQFSVEPETDLYSKVTYVYSWLENIGIVKELQYQSMPGSKETTVWSGSSYVKLGGGGTPAPTEIPEVKSDLGISAIAAENAGKLLYIDANGNAQPLTLGEGLSIVDGVLTIDAKLARAVAGMALAGQVNVGEV